MKEWTWGLFTGAVLTLTTLPASAANLVAYYPLDSYYTLSGVPYTPNLVAGWGDAIVNYSGGAPFQSVFGAPAAPGLSGTSWQETGAAASLRFGTVDPFAATGSFTYALWVYDPFTTAANQQTFLLSKQQANNNHYFRVILRSGATPSTDDMQIGAYNGITGSGTFQDRTTGNFLAAGAGDPSTNWVHIAITGSKVGTTATWQIYANGVPLSFPGGNTTTLDASRANQLMTAGAFATQVAQGYVGTRLDDIRFYDGVLSQAEIITLVPEPSALAMLALGGGLLLVLRRRS